MWQNQFEYINLEGIDQRFKCSICTKPYLDPVCLPQPCEQTFCLQCIQNNFTNHANECQSCCGRIFSIKDLIVEGPVLRQLVNNLLVRCILCHEENILRMKFIEHSQRYCPKRIVHCSAYDVQCSWQGEYDQFNNHIHQCPYEQLRILLTQLANDKQRLTQFNQLEIHFQNLQNQFQLQNQTIDKLQNEKKIIDEQFKQLTDKSNEQVNEIHLLKITNQLNQEQINQFHQLNQSLEEKNQRIDKLQNEKKIIDEQFKQLTDKSNEQINEIHLLKITNQLNQEQINQFHHLNQTLEEKNVQIDKLENENQLLIDSMNKSNSIQNQNQSLIQTNQQQIQLITKENQQLNEQLNNCQIQLEQLNKQLIHFKLNNEQLHQSNIDYQQQIKQLSIDYQRLIAKLYQPIISFDYLSKDSKYENRQLKQLIESCSNKSLINIINETINENDIKIIINDGCINKQCQSIIFIETNFIENSLINFFSYLNLNRTLRKLILSKINFSNQLMECLCQSLLFNNQTIQELILNSNQINDQLMIYLIHLFQINQTIRTIGLQENQITDQSFQQFCHVITLENETIEEISIYSNPFITDQSIQSIIDIIINHQVLKTFWLWNCQLSDQGKQQIQQSIISNQTSPLDLRL